MLLLISKHPQFTDNGEVVLGQCAPYTSGWRLRIFDDGHEEVLLTGTYYDLRRAQQAMAGKDPDEMRRLAHGFEEEFARSARAVRKQAIRRREVTVEETTAVLSSAEVKNAMEQEHQRAQFLGRIQGGIGPDGSFARVTDEEGVLVVAPSCERFLNTPDTVGSDMERLLALAPRGLVIDMEDVQVISTGGLRELVRAADMCSTHGVPMAVANLVSGIRKVLEMASLENILPIHDSVAAAWDSVNAASPKKAPE